MWYDEGRGTHGPLGEPSREPDGAGAVQSEEIGFLGRAAAWPNARREALMSQLADTPIGTDPETQPQDTEPTLGELVRRWFLRASIAGMVLSLVVHILLFLIAALITTGGGGKSPTPGAAIEFAVMSESDLDEFQSEELSVEQPSSEELLEQLADVATDPLLDTPIADLLQPSGKLEAEISGGGGDLNSAGDGAAGGSGTGSASFFGVEARGNRFAYIVDVSGSMDREGRLGGMQAELGNSISGMPDHVGFFVVFFADTAFPLGDRRKWTDADGAGKRWARESIARLTPLGATNPLPAFEMVYDIRPRPDAVYFMTDGEFDESIADIIIRRTMERPLPIHCITFMSREGEAVMRRIARETGGTYTHIAKVGG